MERYYSSRQACQILGISTRTFRRWVSQGKIKAIKVNDRWRVPEGEIKRVLGISPEPTGVRAVIYVHRVLSGHADIDQLKLYELKEEIGVLKSYAELNKWSVVEIVRDVDVIEEKWNGLSRLLSMARDKEFDILLVYSKVDAFGMCYRFIEELLKAYGIRIANVRGAS